MNCAGSLKLTRTDLPVKLTPGNLKADLQVARTYFAHSKNKLTCLFLITSIRLYV
jgi:hypothetical protein